MRGEQTYRLGGSTATLRRDGSLVTVSIDGVESSCVDPARPEHLEFEYQQQMDAVLETLRPAPAPVRALHLGGCACALAWAWETRRPGSTQIAVEVDAALAALAREWFPLPRAPRLRIRVADARDAVRRLRSTFDVVVRDAFAGGRVPAHLQTAEFAREARARVRPDGVYLANCAHGPATPARADAAAVAAAFPSVGAIADPRVLHSARRGNLVLVAGRAGAIDWGAVDALLRRLPLPARLLRPDQLTRWIGGTPPSRDRR